MLFRSEIRHTIFDIFDSTGIGIIQENEYMSIMYNLFICRRALAAFQATDVKEKGLLGYNSIKTLLWLMSDKEPTDKKVSQEIEVMPFVNGEISVHSPYSAWQPQPTVNKLYGLIATFIHCNNSPVL